MTQVSHLYKLESIFQSNNRPPAMKPLYLMFNITPK